MKNKQGNILNDHQRKGSKFIPPGAQIGKIEEISYVNQIFPEIIWMGLLNKREGYRDGVRIVEFMAKRLSEMKNTDEYFNFSLTSSYTQLDAELKMKIVDELKKEQLLPALQKSLAPLTCLYERFPMAFIGPPDEHYSRATLINILKNCISECMDRTSQPGVVMQSLVLYIRGITGHLCFSEGIEPPDLDKILTDFDSEEGN